ncbi:substrate-binding periplasmic protein [Nocardioides humi]|uniref:Solute-binding protein family 3/N-terminal domain-containing protein n=1 Tax=Nocardioides humi TaxID=449461 RepID=A0ABN1ZZX8_9ACTN|nr:transporter substrate-binding domain-containing protein [Nocardioides humi]
MNLSRGLVGVAGTILTAAVLSGCGGSDDSGSSSRSDCTPSHPDVPTLATGDLTVLVYVTPPYTTQEGNGFGGVDATIVKRLAELECLDLKTQSVAAAAGLASIQAERADIAIGGIYYTEERTETLSLSDPMYRDGMALVSTGAVDGTLAGLEGKTIGVVQGYLWNEDFQAALGADNVKLYQDTAGLITDVKNGRLDAAVLTSAEVGFRAKEDSKLTATSFQPTPEIAASTSENGVVLALPKSATALTQALNEDIAVLIGDGTVAAALEAQGMDPALAGPATP